MDAGRLEQVATPRDLYEAPASRWIAEFVGDINLFEGERALVRERSSPDRIDRAMAALGASRSRARRVSTDGRRVAIRPEKVKLSRRGPAADAVNSQPINRLEGVVTDVSYLGGADDLQGQARSRRGGAVVDRQHRAARRRYLSARPARGGLVHARRLRGAGPMSARRIFARPGALCRDRAVCLDGAVLPGAVRLRAEDQRCRRPRSRSRLTCRCSISPQDGRRSRRRLRSCRWTISGCWFRTISTSAPICAASSSR